MTEPELWNPYHEEDRPSFSQWKDVLIPGKLSMQDVVATAKVAPRPSDRPYLGDFVGWNRPLHISQGGTSVPSPRGQLLSMAGVPDLHIRQDVPYAEATTGALSSRFCFVPRGKSAWSSRFFRVLFAGCVPVLLNDYYEPPFDALIDVPSFVIRWPMRAVDERLIDALRAVPLEALDHMLESARLNRCWYLYPPSAVDFEHINLQKGHLDPVCPHWRQENAFMAIMRLLRRRIRRSHTPPPGTAFHIPDESGRPLLLDEQLRVIMPLHG